MTKSKLYSFDDHPEHKDRLEEWRDKWIANALNCEPMTDQDREIARSSIANMYRSAKLEPPDHIIFVPSPICGAIAAPIASAIWWLRENPDKAIELFGKPRGEDSLLMAAYLAVRCAAKYGLDTDNGAATEAVVRNATEAGVIAAAVIAAVSGAATVAAGTAPAGSRKATEVVTEAAIWAATNAAVTRTTIEDEIVRAIKVAIDASTDDGTEDATEAATRYATFDAIKTAASRATWHAVMDATQTVIRDITGHFETAIRDMVGAVLGATSIRTEAATAGKIRAAAAEAEFVAIKDATSAGLRGAIEAVATAAANEDATEAATWSAMRSALIDLSGENFEVAARNAIVDAVDAIADGDAARDEIESATWGMTAVATEDATESMTRSSLISPADVARHLDTAIRNAIEDATKTIKASVEDVVAVAAEIATEVKVKDVTRRTTFNTIEAVIRNATDMIRNVIEDVIETATKNTATRRVTETAIESATSDITEAVIRGATANEVEDATWTAAQAGLTVDALVDATWAAARAVTDATSAAVGRTTWTATEGAIKGVVKNEVWAVTVAATEAATIRNAIVGTISDAMNKAVTRAIRDAIRAAISDATGKTIEAVIFDKVNAATINATETFTRVNAIITTEVMALNRAINLAMTDAIAQTPARNAAVQFFLACTKHWYNFYSGGNQWSGWTSYLSFFRHVADLQLPEYEAFQHYETAAQFGPRFMHKKFCIVSDRPEFIHRDSQNRPHREDGPFCQWRDNWKMYYIHGVPVTERVVMHPETITVQEIESAQNVELRRVLIERYGAVRYVQDSGAKLIHQDRWGKLWAKPVPNDEDMVFVEVENSTPELDGSKKKYYLRVPPQTETAHAAVAWTFGHEPTGYSPVVET